jgi:hypothetical protein
MLVLKAIYGRHVSRGNSLHRVSDSITPKGQRLANVRDAPTQPCRQQSCYSNSLNVLDLLFIQMLEPINRDSGRPRVDVRKAVQSLHEQSGGA